MCGLAGFQSINNGDSKGKINKLRVKMLLQYLSESRGKDSTGIFTPELGVVKSAETASKFLEAMYNGNIDFTKIDEASIFIGHVRQKTHGEKKAANAHPFKYNNIVGAHNGVLTNHVKLIPANEFPIDYPVDSMVIFSRLQKDNNYKVLSEMLGAAAIIFYNYNEPNLLYAYRNEDRPLWYGYVDGEGLYLGSTEESLKIIDCRDIKEIKPNILYKFKNGEVKESIKIARAHDPESLLLTSLASIKDTKLLIGFNLLVNHTNSKIASKYLEPKKDFVYVKGQAYTSGHNNINTISSYSIKATESFEHDITNEAFYLSDLDVESYNAFFKKGAIVRAIRDFNYAQQGKKKNKKPERACIKWELFIITKPLEKRTSRTVTITSLLEPKKVLIMDVSHLQAVVNSKLLEESCKLINLNLDPASSEIETIVEGHSDNPKLYNGIQDDKLFSFLDTKIRKEIGHITNVNPNEFKTLVEEQLAMDFEQVEDDFNKGIIQSLNLCYNRIKILKDHIAQLKNDIPGFTIGSMTVEDFEDNLESLAMDLISIYDSNLTELPH